MPQLVKQNKRDKVRLNVMVIGESGLGKTTFLNCLLGRYDLKHKDSNDPDTSHLTIADKTNNIEKVGKFELISESGDSLDVYAYDSPGYGDFLSNQECIDKIKSYLLKCHKTWKDLDPQSMTEADMNNADGRIHCIFYFIGPHRMKLLDRECIKQIAPIVPVIPIIAKADTMTVQERNEYVNTVKLTLDEISNKLHEPCTYDFKMDDLEAVTAIDEANAASGKDEIPKRGTIVLAKITPTKPSSVASDHDNTLERLPNIFAVVCDKTFERVYPWGTLRIDDNRHSDFRRLQVCLFENGNHLKGLLDQTRLKSIKLFANEPKKK